MTTGFAFLNFSTAVAGTGTASGTATLPALQVGDLMISVIGYQGVAAGAGPFVTTAQLSARGWSRLLYAGPSATGNAVEVITALFGAGGTIAWNFSASVSYSMRVACYTNTHRTNDYQNQEQTPPTSGVSVGSPITDAAVPVITQLTGGNPATASRLSNADDLIVAVFANQLASPGYGVATNGFTKRFDNTFGGFGTVEIALSDRAPTVAGSYSTGFTATASPAGQLGVAAIFGVAPPPRRYPFAVQPAML